MMRLCLCAGCNRVSSGVLAAIGALLSIYLMDVDRQVATKPGYAAACDLGERISTTETLKAPSCSLAFGVRNTCVFCPSPLCRYAHHHSDACARATKVHFPGILAMCCGRAG